MLRIFTILAILFIASSAWAQDYGASHMEKPQDKVLPPEPATDFTTPVRVLPDKTISGNDHLIPCGQACSFEAAAESMAVMGYYFKDIKESSQIVLSNEYRQNVKQCTEDPTSCANDENRSKALLESSLHYNVAKFIRNSYLESTTNREGLYSLGTDKDTVNNPDVMENPNQKWLTGEGTWASVKGQINVRIDERPRDTFQFDLDQFKDTPDDKLKKLDPEFYKQYSSFFSNYSKMDDQSFVQARQIGNNSRRIASADPNDSADFQKDFDKNGKPILQLGIQRDVTQGMAGASRSLNNASKIANKIDVSKDGGNELRHAPSIFGQDDNYSQSRKNDLDDFIAQLKTNPNMADPEIRGKLDFYGLKPNTPLQAMLSQLEDRKKSYDLEDKKAKAPKEIATDINRYVQGIIQTRKSAADNDTKSIHMTLDVQAFDQFIECIWPTGEGEKYRAQLAQQTPPSTPGAAPTKACPDL